MDTTVASRLSRVHRTGLRAEFLASALRHTGLGCLLAGLLLSAGHAAAQSTTATLVGRVLDGQRRAAPEAVVQVRATDTGRVRTAVTDAEGRFRLDALAPGRWVVLARHPRGEASPAQVVELRLQQKTQIELILGAGGVEETVRVEGTDRLDRRRTDTRTVIGGDVIESLPTNGRETIELALLDSSVQASETSGFIGERAPVFVVNGQSGRANSYLVDGLDNNDRLSGTALNSSFSQLVIDEFVVLKSDYAAEFGRATGGILNMLTRRGTNELSWDVFVQGSDSSFNSDGSFIEGLPDGGSTDGLNRFQGGFRMGGPIEKDRAFFFVAYEHRSSDRLSPYTGVGRDGVAGGRFTAPSRGDQLFARADWALDPRNDLSVRFSYSSSIDRSVGVSGVFTPETGTDFDEDDVQLTTSLTTVVSPTMINELRFLVGGSELDQSAVSDRPNVARPSGVFGGNQINRQDRDETKLQLIDNVTLTRGRHTLKTGFDLIYSDTTVDLAFNPNGGFTYDTDAPFQPGDCFVNPGDPGIGFFDVAAAVELNSDLDPDNDVDLVFDCPGTPGIDDNGDGQIDEPADLSTFPRTFSIVRGDTRSRFEDTTIGLFVQDSFSPSDVWTFDFGLRYDLSSYTVDNRVDSVIPNGGAGRDTDNIAPRFGFTWTPNDRWAVRGGAGVFYDKLVLAFPALTAATAGTTISVATPQGATIEYDENLLESEGLESTIVFLGLDDGLFDSLLLRFSTGTELKTPNTIQTSIGFDRLLGRHSSVGARVTRVRGFNQPLLVDLNPVDGVLNPGTPCEEEFLQPLIIGIPCHLNDPSTGSIATVSTVGKTWYDAVNLTYQYRREGLWLSSGYTWSKSEDLGPDPLRDLVSLTPNSRDLFGERARSDTDRRHRLVLSGGAPMPWGLELTGVLTLQSGLPFNVLTGKDDNLDGLVKLDRPDGVGRNAGRVRARPRGSDTDLSIVNDLRSRNDLAPVTELDEPTFSQLDVRVARPFVLGEKGRGEFYLAIQIFNALDELNAGRVEGRVLAQNFGDPITLAGPPRTVELGIRVGY